MKLTAHQSTQIRTTIIFEVGEIGRPTSSTHFKSLTAIVDGTVGKRLDNLVRGGFLNKSRQGSYNKFTINEKGIAYVKENKDKIISVSKVNELLALSKSKGLPRKIRLKAMPKAMPSVVSEAAAKIVARAEAKIADRAGSTRPEHIKKHTSKKPYHRRGEHHKTGPMSDSTHHLDDISQDQAQEHLRQQGDSKSATTENNSTDKQLSLVDEKLDENLDGKVDETATEKSTETLPKTLPKTLPQTLPQTLPETLPQTPLQTVEQDEAIDNMTFIQMRDAVRENYDLRRKVNLATAEVAVLKKRLIVIQKLSSMPCMIDGEAEEVSK